MPRDPTEDLFTARTWLEIEEEESRRNAPPPPPPPPPQAPPLPFAFIGKLVDGEITSVFLVRGDRNYAARRGDTLDGTYLVEEIGEETMTLAYLPLGARQSLAIGTSPRVGAGPRAQEATEAEIPLPFRASAPPTHDLSKLVWIAPPRVDLGEEFTIEIGLPAGPQARSGRVELVYDGRILAVLGGASTGLAAPGTATARRAIVDLIGPGFQGGQPTPTEVRFQVLAADPTTTQLSLENLSAVTAEGSALVVERPRPHRLAVGQGQGTERKPD